MKLFILEVYMGDRWRPRSFFTGTYREAIETLGDNFTAACRLRRVSSLKEYTELESYLVVMMVPGGEIDRFNWTASVPTDGIEWVAA